MQIIEVKNVSFNYGPMCVLKDLNFEVPAGKFLAILGPNGAGKSTLLKLVAGLLKSGSGDILIDGKNINQYSPKNLASKLSYVRQEHQHVFGYSVLDTVLTARLLKKTIGFYATQKDHQAAIRALKYTDIEDLAGRDISALSGGEKQRVFISMALAQETPIMLLDEPTSWLDMRHQMEIFDLLKRLQQEHNKTIITITHDINLACQYADTVLLIAGKRGYRYGDIQKELNEITINDYLGVKTIQTKIYDSRFFLMPRKNVLK